VIASHGPWAELCRTRFSPEESAAVLEEVRARAGSQTLTLQTPSAEIAARCRALGFRDPDPPLEPTCTALASEREPPEVDGIEVRRIETLEEFRQGLEIVLAASHHRDDDAARQRAEAEQRYAFRRLRGAEWLAYVDGRPVAYAGAVAGDRGLYLSGGATLPEARGRGCYRALVRARWDFAVERGTPGLVVLAQETSRAILERCGFERVCTIHELVQDP
jgi:GNAT superfamily N-acetyltransferase